MRAWAVLLPLLTGAAPVELTVHVVADHGAPIADDAWLDTELAAAVERLGAAVTRSAGPAPGPATVATVEDRDALAAAVTDDRTVHVFVVRRVADKDRAGAVIGGVTWQHAHRRYIIVSRDDARDDTLAHELGHFFGLGHTRAADNLMTPLRDPGGRLTDAQRAIVHRRIAAFTAP